MVGGRLNPAAVLDSSEHHCRIVAIARQLAAAEAVGLTPEHFRHAAYQHAIGRVKSHVKFTNREFDAVLNFFGDERSLRGLLICPEDLGSIIHEANPALKQRERWRLGLRRDFLGGYVADLAQRMFGTRDWEQLPDIDLSALHHIMQDRPNGRIQKAKCKMQNPEPPDSAFSIQHSELPAEDPDWSVA